MAEVIVSNSYVGNNPDYAVKVTDANGVVQPGNTQHINISGFAPPTGGSLTNYTTPTVEASKVVKASAGTLFVISGFNQNAADRYVHVFDATAVPADGATPAIVIYAVGDSTFGYGAPAMYGRYFSTGITIAFSSTLETLTIAGADMHLDIQYV